MLYRITIEPDYLRADLYHRETLQETGEFLEAVAESSLKHGRAQILLSVHSSRPLFRIGKLLDRFEAQLKEAPFRMALLADSEELEMANQYAEVLARPRGGKVQSFREEAAALRWLRSPK